MSRNIKIILSLSIILNLLLIGLVAGHAIKRASYHREPQEAIEQVADTLTTEKREMVQSVMQTMREQKREQHKAMREAREKLMDIFTAPEFDPEAFQQAAQSLHDQHGVRGQQMTEAFTKLGQSLTQEERQALAKAMRKFRPDRRHH